MRHTGTLNIAVAVHVGRVRIPLLGSILAASPPATVDTIKRDFDGIFSGSHFGNFAWRSMAASVLVYIKYSFNYS